MIQSEFAYLFYIEIIIFLLFLNLVVSFSLPYQTGKILTIRKEIRTIEVIELQELQKVLSLIDAIIERNQ